MRYRADWRVVPVLVVLGMATAAPANADLLASNLVGAQSVGGYAVGQYPGTSTDYAIGWDFTIPFGGAAQLGYGQILASGADGSMVVSLYSTSGGLPFGAPIESWNLNNLPSSPGLVTFASASNPALAGGQTFALVAAMANPATTGYWWVPPGVTGQTQIASVNGGAFFAGSSLAPGGFALYSLPGSQVTPPSGFPALGDFGQPATPPTGAFGISETVTQCTTTCGQGAYVDTIGIANNSGDSIIGYEIGNYLAGSVLSSPQIGSNAPWVTTTGSVTYPNGTTENSIGAFDPSYATDGGLAPGFDLAESGSLATGGAISPYILYVETPGGQLESFAGNTLPVPEPSGLVTMLAGLGLVAGVKRRRRSSATILIATAASADGQAIRAVNGCPTVREPMPKPVPACLLGAVYVAGGRFGVRLSA